ncbi:MAG TPA: hypothetical protein VL357_09490 [Rariglobus sp.]|nr:hypothetical protein [Rariglobus sp.]
MNKPIRFRRVCPLLVPGADGRGAFCSVPADKVRPFWGRAFIFLMGGLAGGYLAGATVLFVGVRMTGVDSLAWHQVVWPGSWGEISHERSQYFFKRAILACARQDYPLAYRSMATALEEDPHNYDVRLLMAQYAEFAGDFITADQFFEQILREFPKSGLRTAITWHDTLLSVGRPKALAAQCLRMAVADKDRRFIWTGSLLLAMHLGHLGPDFVAKNEEAIGRLGPDIRSLVQAEALLVSGDVPAALAGLRHPFSQPVDGNLVIQQIQFFLRAGAPADAEVAWTVNAHGLDEFDRRLARCWIDRAMGYAPLGELEFSALADRSHDEATLDKLVATLVMQPDQEWCRSLHRRVLKGPEPVTPAVASEMWLAAMVCGLPLERDFWTNYNAEKFHMTYPRIEAVDFGTLKGSQAGTVPFLVGMSPFGRNTIAALYWRVKPPGGAVGGR